MMESDASHLPTASSFWCIVPAAGIGKRMGQVVPKQYLKVSCKTIAEHSIQRLLQFDRLQMLVVAIADDDCHWSALDISQHPKIKTVKGGAERSASVLNGLRALEPIAKYSDWVLVHDIARPCIRVSDIECLAAGIKEHEAGGILASPVSDTIKRSFIAGVPGDSPVIDCTLDRSVLWRALTPQMFRYGLLKLALENALVTGAMITDEASAIEMAGYHPLLIRGRSDNIKVTDPEDLHLAEFILQSEPLETER